MTDFDDLLERAEGLLAELARVTPEQIAVLADETLCATVVRVETVGRLVDALRAVAAAELEQRSVRDDSLARRLGCVRGSQVVERLTRCSAADAARRIRLGAAIRPTVSLLGEALPPRHPHVASAVLGGELGVDAASGILHCLGQAASTASPAAVEVAESALVERAQTVSADLVLEEARLWREALDPDGAAPREEELRHRRGFTVGRERQGMTPFSGWADPVSAGLLRAMLSEGTNPKAVPRFIDASELEPDGDRLRDPRTSEQRQFDVLIGTITAGLRSTEQGGAARPMSTVTAVIRLDDLRTGGGLGWIDDVLEPVTAATIRQLACDSGFTIQVVADNGKPLYLGRTARLFSGPQRRALGVRDGGCVWPNCTAPPGWCEAHHVTEWENGGLTDIDNGLLLCSVHHHLLHATDFSMRMIDGMPHLLAPPWIDGSGHWQPVGRNRALAAV
jgi:hypothetical protein